MSYSDTLRGLRQVASQLSQEIDDLDQEIASLTEQRSLLVSKLADINSAISTVDSLTGDSPQDSVTRTQTRTFKEQLTSAIHEALLREGPLHRKTILNRVSSMGIQIGLTNPLASLASYLSTDDRFVNVGKGIWALAGQATNSTVNETPRHANITANELTGFTKLSDALAVIAMRHDGIVHCSEAARLLLEAGVTQAATRASANAVIHRTLNQSEEWEKTEPGVFRYLPFSAALVEVNWKVSEEPPTRNDLALNQLDLRGPIQGGTTP